MESLLADADPSVIRYSRGVQLAISYRDRLQRALPRPELSVCLRWGDAGTGKTSSVYAEHGYGSVFTLVTAANGSVWFDGYEGQDVLLIDDYRGFIPFQYFLKILDIYPLRLDVKGSFCYANWTKIYITSNHPIEEWYREDSHHHLPALRRRIHRVEHFSADSPWSIAALAALRDGGDSPAAGDLSGDEMDLNVEE